jgi:hypothetical protein
MIETLSHLPTFFPAPGSGPIVTNPNIWSPPSPMDLLTTKLLISDLQAHTGGEAECLF